MIRIFRYVVTVALLTGLLAGCGGLLPRSTYSRPELNLPQGWQGEATTTGKTVAGGEAWWRDFDDPLLSSLIERALMTNNDLAAAAIRVRRAQLNVSLTATNLTPTVSAEASSSASRDLERHRTMKSSGLTGTVSYELDLWGKLAASRDASRWEAQATESDRQSTALALIGTTARDYWQIAYLNERVATAEASVAYAEKTLALVEAKYAAGAVSSLDVVKASQTVASQRADLTRLLRQRTEARNALAILFDQAPGNAVPERERLPDGPLPALAAGLPASLVGRRPDLRAAEQRLRKLLANVDGTRASYYPSITLTGNLGTSSASLLSFLQNPSASLGAALALPFIQWNTMQLSVGLSRTEYEEAVVNFRQSLYSALSDVENALAGRARYDEENGLLERSLRLARTAEELAGVQYREGSTALQSWLDAQEARRGAEVSLAENRLNRLGNLMALYQALGGGMGEASEPEGFSGGGAFERSARAGSGK